MVLSFKGDEIKEVEIVKNQIPTIISKKEKPAEKTDTRKPAEEKDATSGKDVQKQFEWQTADGKIMEASKVKDLISYFTDLRCDTYIEEKKICIKVS